MAWYFEDESMPATDEQLDRVVANGARVPRHWRLEVTNTFQSAQHHPGRPNVPVADAMGWCRTTFFANAVQNGALRLTSKDNSRGFKK
jgi:hypothetical protein